MTRILLTSFIRVYFIKRRHLEIRNLFFKTKNDFNYYNLF